MNEQELQEKFLIKLAETADIAESLAHCNLQNIHLMSWCAKQPKFDLAYRSLKHQLCSHLASESYLAAKKAILTELTDASSRKEITISQEFEYTVNEAGDEICVGKKTKTQTKDRAIAAWAIKEALDVTTFVKAVEKMVAEGTLSNDQHKQLMTTADRAVDEFQTIIGNLVDNKESLTETKTIALINQAIMGAIQT